METINIICVDDQEEVLDTVTRDLRSLEKFFRIESANSAEDCLSLMKTITERGDFVGVVISDHVMPNTTGIDLLGKISKSPKYPHIRKVLLTGLATHADTIRAINEASIDKYFEKPWNAEDLLKTVKVLLTDFVIDSGFEYEDYIAGLDSDELLNKLKK